MSGIRLNALPRDKVFGRESSAQPNKMETDIGLCVPGERYTGEESRARWTRGRGRENCNSNEELVLFAREKGGDTPTGRVGGVANEEPSETMKRDRDGWTSRRLPVPLCKFH